MQTEANIRHASPDRAARNAAASACAIPLAARESWFAAADGHALRRIDWQVQEPSRGSLLFLPGRGDSYEKWLETLDGWSRDGWTVSAIDWRGQALSGRLGIGAPTGHIDDFADWIADLSAFWRSWQAERPGPHVLVGHSMGGHLALRAVADEAVNPAALVLSAPMLGIHPQRVPAGALHRLVQAIARLGDPRRPAWGGGSEKPGAWAGARQLLLTHDDARYADEALWRAERPDIAMGAASWGWLRAALASIRRLEAPGVLEALRIPVLILATRADRLVSWRAIERGAARLPVGELVAFGPECRHEILREADPVRARALSSIDSFLNRQAPARG